MKQLHNNLYIAGQIKADDFAELAEAGIKVIINNRPDNEEQNQLDHQQAEKLAAQYGMQYHYLPMANGQPLPQNLVSDYQQIVENCEQPILAHCRSGMRSTFIWALGAIAAQQVSVGEAIDAAQNAGIALSNYRSILESVVPEKNT